MGRYGTQSVYSESICNWVNVCDSLIVLCSIEITSSFRNYNHQPYCTMRVVCNWNALWLMQKVLKSVWKR